MTAPNDIAAVIAVLGPDLTAEEWAARLGVSLTEVRRAARSEGVSLAGEVRSRGNRALPRGAEQIIVAARHGGRSLTEIADAFGVHHTTVMAIVKRAEGAPEPSAGSPRREHNEQVRAAILERLRKAPTDRYGLALMLGMCPSNAWKHLRALEAGGRVERVPGWARPNTKGPARDGWRIKEAA